MEQQPWGKPYKVVMGKLFKSPAPAASRQHDLVQKVVDTLFPVHPTRPPADWPVDKRQIPAITEEELRTAARQLKMNTAPGLDRVPNEVLKVITDARPQILLQLYNRCLVEGIFPCRWKRARLVLIKKGDRPPNEPTSYRPLCLLDCTGKLFEKVIDNRLRVALENEDGNGLSESQFGFRKGRSTIHALEEVIKFADESGGRQKVGLVTLDVQNAFNAAPWDRIKEAMLHKELPYYLCRVVNSYLSDRTIHFKSNNGERSARQVSYGVPQGSVLGPTL